MAKNSANVAVNIINNAQSVNLPTAGIIFMLGETLRGQKDNPEDIITSVTQFERLYGGVSGTNDFPLMCEQALRAGAKLRVSRVVGAGSLPATSGALQDSATSDLFTLTSKGEGAYYNDYDVIISTATSADANQFNMTISDPTLGVSELYENLEVTEVGAAAPYTYLKQVIDNSRMVSVTYSDISGLSGDKRPDDGTTSFTTGADGTAPTITHYTGSAAAKTGIYAFDDYDDSWLLSVPAKSESDLAGLFAMGRAYCQNRKDMVWVQHLPNADNTATAITTELSGYTSGDKFCFIVGGGEKITDPLLGGTKNMMNTGEVLALIANSNEQYGPWYSPAGYNRGVLREAFGVVNNFGSPGSATDLSLITNAGANMVVLKNNQIVLWDAYTMAEGTSPEKFLSVVLLELYMQKALKPALESFLGEPNEFDTWRRIYYTVKPFLDSLVDDKALYEYKWDGDQFATALDQLQINDATDVGNGLYKVQLQIKAVSPMVEITLDIILTENSVEFN